jgi:hypothetical protein
LDWSVGSGAMTEWSVGGEWGQVCGRNTAIVGDTCPRYDATLLAWRIKARSMSAYSVAT